jgi:hypothetical protein
VTNRGFFDTTLTLPGTVADGKKDQEGVVMAEEIKVGDWISYRRSGLAGRAAKRALGRHKPSRKGLGGPKKIAVAPEEATLIEAQWSLIEPLLPPRRGRVGRPLHDHRRVLGGILWVARTGCSRREMLEEYADFSTAYRRWRAW